MYLKALFNLLYTTPLTSTYCNTLINFIMVIYYNYKKDSYFILSYLKLKDIGNIKKKRKKINLSQLMDRKYFIVLYIVL